MARSKSMFVSPLARTRPSLVLSRTPKGARLLARMLGVLLLMTSVALWCVPWQQNLPGHGRVIAHAPLERQQIVEAPIEGRIQEWFVAEGSRVHAGDPIATIADNDPEILGRLERERQAVESRRAATQVSIDVGASRVAALELARTTKSASATLRVDIGRDRLDAAARAVEAAESAERAARLNLERVRALFQEGLGSKRQLELAELEAETRVAELRRAEASLKASKREIGALDADAGTVGADATAEIEAARDFLAKAESELAKTDQELQKLEVRLARQQRMTITAPRDGTILQLIAKQGTEMVVAGDPVVAFVPDMRSSAVELWFDGKDGPLIDPGRKVRVQFEGWPALQFVGWPSTAIGTFGGIVEFVDATADEHGRFRVVVSPNPEDEPWPDSRWLRQGVRANGWVLLDQVSLGFELWRQLNGFPPAVEAPLADARSPHTRVSSKTQRKSSEGDE
jgi:adhesin transport system membrane fusion protein